MGNICSDVQGVWTERRRSGYMNLTAIGLYALNIRANIPSYFIMIEIWEEFCELRGIPYVSVDWCMDRATLQHSNITLVHTKVSSHTGLFG